MAASPALACERPEPSGLGQYHPSPRTPMHGGRTWLILRTSHRQPPPWLQADRPHRLPTDRAAQPHPSLVLGSPGCEHCLHIGHAAFGAAAGDARTAPQSPEKGCTGPGTSAGSQLPPLGPGERGGRRHTLARTRGGPRSAYAQRPSGFTQTGSSFLKSQTRDGKIRGPDHLDWGHYAREQGYEAEFSRDGDGGQAAL